MKVWLIFFLLPVLLTANLRALFTSLDPTSLSQHIAFYELYPKTPEGNKALKKIFYLLNEPKQDLSITFPHINMETILQLIYPLEEEKKYSTKELKWIQRLSSHFANRKLKGYKIFTLQELFTLPLEEIDLCRGLLLSEFEEQKNAQEKILYYESIIDLMALQIQAKLPEHPTDMEKIHAINKLIFHEMQFRFPPNALWSKEIDSYTFLPSVIDQRQGVCLGISVMYLCLAQRLNLQLEAITPPGHIYVRHIMKDGSHLNIETTVRGIHIPTEQYKGFEGRVLEKRTIFEVIGLTFMNQAAVFWSKKDFDQALNLYHKAAKFIRNDPKLWEFLGYQNLFLGRRMLAEKYFKKALQTPERCCDSTIMEDYLSRKISIEGIQTIFDSPEETFDSLLEKKKHLETLTKQYPKFRAGWMQLSHLKLSLHREKEALSCLKTYFSLDSTQAKINYYLSIIALQRKDYKSAWQHLQLLETLIPNKTPKPVVHLRRSLERLCPEINSSLKP